VLKKGGVDIEKSQLGTPQKIQKLLIMSLKASVEAIRLTNARAGDHFIPLTEMFAPAEYDVLTTMNKELSGKTEKVTNPHRNDSLAWAAWIIARLGGWHGYESQGPAGPVSMDRGLKELRKICFYATIFKDP
jgi:hypothetical protein